MGSGEDLYIKMNSRGKPLTPFENFKAMNDTELDALFTFLKTLPPKASGSR